MRQHLDAGHLRHQDLGDVRRAAGAIPNYIFPLTPGQYYSAANVFQFQYLLYRPLYSFGTDGQVQLNSGLSLADPPVYSNGGKSVTVTLKGWKWSDGLPVTARDVQFWQNLVAANKAYWPAYVPGEYPDNVLTSTINPANPLQITFNLDQAYGSYFFTYNELSQITPLPQHVWDKESAAGPVGNYDQTPAGAKAVYAFLDSQSRSVNTYDTNPLWQVVSGPWRLKSMDTAGNVRMVPNPQYGGPVKPTLKEFDEVPFSQETVEFNRLRSASSVARTSVDFGYLPADEAAQKSSLAASTTSIRGALVDQLRRRQLHQSHQRADVQPAVFPSGDAGPGGSAPSHRQGLPRICESDVWPCADRALVPIRRRLGARQSYPYSPTAAQSLLQANGWTVKSGGVSTCAKPGTATGDCGAGIKQGQPASLGLQYVSGSPSGHSGDAPAGVRLRPGGDPDQAVAGLVRRGPRLGEPCTPGAACTWDLAYWDSPWIYRPDYYPSGDQLWACTGSAATSGLRGLKRGRVLRPASGGGHRRHRVQRPDPGDGRLRGLHGQSPPGHLGSRCRTTPWRRSTKL